MSQPTPTSNPSNSASCEVWLHGTPISCGFPSPADEYLETPLDLNEYLVKKPAATFFVRAKGTSMINAGIFEGDIIVVDRSITPRSGQIIVAVVNGEFTLKKFTQKNNKVILVAENPTHPPLEITDEMGFEIWGVAVHCLHKLP